MFSAVLVFPRNRPGPISDSDMKAYVHARGGVAHLGLLRFKTDQQIWLVYCRILLEVGVCILAPK